MSDRVREVMRHGVDSVSSVDGGGERLAVLVNRDWLGKEGVQERVGIQGIQLGSGIAIDLRTWEVTAVIQIFSILSYCVPGLASE